MTQQYHDFEYLKMLQYILQHGIDKPNRTGVAARSTFGYQMTFDLSDGSIPLLTTKKMFIKGIITELLWYLTGDTNIKYLTDRDVHIWTDWADEDGDLGPGIYGNMWRHYPNPIGEPIDQIAALIDKLKNNCNDRRLIVNAWCPGLISVTSLPPCHYAFQCWVGDGKLSLMIHQRSVDSFLGCPFNIASYAILLHMLAHVSRLLPGKLVWMGGDTHIYSNHFDQVKEQLSREPYPSPILKFARSVDDIDDFKFEDFIVEHYQSHPIIKAPIAV